MTSARDPCLIHKGMLIRSIRHSVPLALLYNPGVQTGVSEPGRERERRPHTESRYRGRLHRQSRRQRCRPNGRRQTLRAIIVIMIAVILFDLSTAHKSDRQCDEQE